MHASTEAPAEITAESLFGPLPINLEQLSKLFLAAKTAGESGRSLGRHKNIAPQNMDRLYEQAIVQCGEGRWSDACLIALQLALHEPRNSRYLFLGGTCLQRMMEFEAAAGLYSLSLIDDEQPIVVFRMAECLAAASQFDQARKAFDSCFEMCRGDLDLRDVQEACAQALVRLTPH
ncbi:hypothetical protein [Hydrogenophaga sp.]|uniref:hypothetical protein n=1 Tax=Hydrogenophaga sp. TaxID=1904254 RepID=UPI00271BD32D|nr:hypothetical protein [Hydrogenophaga sp.]MDO9436746.1 hypothetical protein [Hydrogenophaga sp.]